MEGQKYSIEFLDVSYIPTAVADKDFGMYLLARVQYGDSAGFRIIHELVSINGPQNDPNSMWSEITFITGWKENACLNRFIPSLDIAEHHFNNVYADPFIKSPTGMSYSEIFYTKDRGIVGFQDKHGVMWALDRLE